MTRALPKADRIEPTEAVHRTHALERLINTWLREGWRNLLMVFDSIWRMRSRVTPNVSPIWSRVLGWPSPRPKRMRITPASRSLSESRSDSSWRCSMVKPTASAGTTAV